MFKNIYVDKKNSTFTLWTTDGKIRKSKFKCRSWVENPGIENASYSTIYGVPVVPVLKPYMDELADKQRARDSEEDIQVRSESDIQPEIRILSELYEKEES